ncbi:glycosyl hydrolase family 28-related protein [Lentisphaera profundi]|uniref:Glycosyl hydrolase family 28-related protein n=1 Tax=Lentisphaera profundi TaxID=1658616 RepID=A0ABY7VQL4_9BACT|nr:glycosyl hydrolase family 28-related protein [Lentisphaera profundi]WDE96480.1 glycosyl hydrolase family 28-related protein [Lentisphaera profundi]
MNLKLQFFIICIQLSSLLLGVGQHSSLWGKEGELWTPKSQLPDFSFAGYHSGEKAIPRVPITTNVTDYGAIPNSGKDGTQAFIKAIEQTESGVIFIPAGHYILSDILWIKKSNIALRGAGPEKTILEFRPDLEDVRPNMGKTTSGKATSNYSWSGGFIWIKGSYREKFISKITQEAERGSYSISVANPAKLKVGQYITIELREDKNKSLIKYLYSGDSGDITNLKKTVKTKFTTKITAVNTQEILIERPLPFDIKLTWNPFIKTFNPSVSESGVEDLSITFPNTAYQGHFSERGKNGIALNSVANCWVRNVHFQNCDSGLYMHGQFCTAMDLVFKSDRLKLKNNHMGYTGHHGLSAGLDCLFENFDFQTHFIHDLGLSHANRGNVFKNGRGLNLSLDHHRQAPYENLFSNLDAGIGSDLWRCGGGKGLGKHCGARGTFWNIRTEKKIKFPKDDFGPPSLNFIGLNFKKDLAPSMFKHEDIQPQKLIPADIHSAQLQKRLRKKSSSASNKNH